MIYLKLEMKKTGELKGYKIFNLTKRKGTQWLKKVKIPISIGTG